MFYIDEDGKSLFAKYSILGMLILLYFMSVWLYDKYIKSTALYFKGICLTVKNHYIISS